MSKKSHYETLGVDAKATKEEIKKAYRQLSMKYHPDKLGGNVEKSQEINEAYEILKDEQSRMEYDQETSCQPHFQFASNMHSEFDDIIGAIFGGHINGFQNGGIRIFHQASMPMYHHNMFQISKPEPIIKKVNIDFAKLLQENQISLEIEKWVHENGNKIYTLETFQVTIPQGVEDNEIIVLKEQGHVLNDYGLMLKGDINIVVNVQNTTLYKRNGLDLIMNLDITFKQSLCGFSIQLPYINGNEYTLNSTKGTIIQNESSKLIPNLGLRRHNQTGNLIIVFKITNIPILSDSQVAKLNEILE